MVYTKRTTKSTGKGSRTTNTKTITASGKTKITNSRSSGSKTQRFTSSTSINSSTPTKQYITTNVGGWRKTTLLNSTSKKKAFSKSKTYKVKKSKPLSLFGWILLIFMFIALAYS